MVKRRKFLEYTGKIGASLLAGHGLIALPSCGQELEVDGKFQSIGSDGNDYWTSTDPFLSGNNAPVFQEQYIKDLKVIGQLPEDMEGIYFRNGPNPKFKPQSYRFPVDGDGMIHALYFENGKVSYRNKWVMTEGLKKEIEAGQSLYGNIFSGGERKNCASTSIVYHGNHLLALYEGGLPYKLNLDLETVGEWNYNNAIGPPKMSAHPRIDKLTGNMHFCGYSLFEEPYLTYYVADAAGNIIVKTPIDAGYPTMVHDMVITDNYVIFFICPAIYDGSGFKWVPESGTRICVQPKGSNGSVRWFEVEAFFIWHFMNAYENGNRVIIDFIHHGKPGFAAGSGISSPPNLHQAILNLDNGSAVINRLDSRIVEYPTVNPLVVGSKYRYGYASLLTTFSKYPEYYNKIIQYDHENNSEQVYSPGDNEYCGEPLIIPSQNTSDEGYVLTFVFNDRSKKSSLQILEQNNFSSGPIAEVILPVRIPNGLHGHWMEGPG